MIEVKPRSPFGRLPIGNRTDISQPKEENEMRNLTDQERETRNRQDLMDFHRQVLQVLHNMAGHGVSPKVHMAKHLMWSFEGVDPMNDCREIARFHDWDPATSS